MPLLHMLSARPADLTSEQRQERQSRSSSKQEIANQIARAKMLAEGRDTGTRKLKDMSPADKRLLEDFDTERLAKRRKMILVQKPPAFRSQLSEAAPAAEHGAASSSASVNVHPRSAPRGPAQPLLQSTVRQAPAPASWRRRRT